MLQDYCIAVFTDNTKLYRKLADMARRLDVPLAQFNGSARPADLHRWAHDGHLVALVDGSEGSDAALRWVGWFSSDRPGTVCVWMEKQFNQDHIVKAMRAGARDVLAGPFDADDLNDLLRRVGDLFVQHQSPSSVFALTGAAGGVGVSTVTANLADQLARSLSVRVGIVDLDTSTSTAGLLLDLRPELGLFDLWERGTNVDTSLLRRAAASRGNGIHLISAQGWPGEQLPLPENFLYRVLLLSRQEFDYVLVDVPRGVLPAASGVLQQTAEGVVLVTHCSMSCAAGAAAALQSLTLVGYTPSRLLWVANTVCEPAGIRVSQMGRILARKPAVKIPFDPQAVNRAAEEGRPLVDIAPRSAVTKAIAQLAHSVCRRMQTAQKQIPTGGLHRRNGCPVASPAS